MIDTTQIKPDPAWSHKPYYPFYYKGLRVEQNRNIFHALDCLSTIKTPSQIIEIGASNGGFTKVLEDHEISKNAKIYSIELTNSNANAVYGDKVIKIKGNCFELEEQIGKLISLDGLSLVFCDGGNKNLEINTFSKFLKKKDLIFGHDYAPTKEFWQSNFNGKVWDWHETWDSAIEETCVKYNLIPFLQEEFLNAVWKSLEKN